MRMAFFTIPVHDAEEATTALNQFLSSQRVIAVDRHFVQDGHNSAWSLCVSFVPTGDTRAAIPARRGATETTRMEWASPLTRTPALFTSSGGGPVKTHRLAARDGGAGL